jgi:hypothetical protein
LAIAHGEYGWALFALGLLSVDLFYVEGLMSFREALGQGIKTLTKRGGVGLVGGGTPVHAIEGGILYHTGESVLHQAGGSCVNCTLKAAKNLYSLLGRSIDEGGEAYRGLISKFRHNRMGEIGDLAKLIEDNAKASGKPWSRMSFANAAAQNKPFIAIIDTDQGVHFHAVVVEDIFVEGGRKVAKVIDSEYEFKYVIDYADLEQRAEVWEASGSKGAIVTG